MKILLTGATGYIAQRLLPVLIDLNHHVVCCVRDAKRFQHPYSAAAVSVIEVDFLNRETLDAIPDDVDVAYYLIHSMSANEESFELLEQQCALNFTDRLNETSVKQVVYLSGIVNDAVLSKHLASRKRVEYLLAKGDFALTTLRAGIIVGSGSASFEIIRDLVEKLPVMVAPKWLNTRCQPIAIREVIQYLCGVIDRQDCYDQSFDIGGPDILSYREMLSEFARIRRLRRTIIVVPVMTPRLSSYWLYFVTSTSYQLACNLVDSMSVEVVCAPNDLHERLSIRRISYAEAIGLAFDKIAQNRVLSSWKDAQSSSLLDGGVERYMEVPSNGCFVDRRTRQVKHISATIDRIWKLGGNTGWYYATWLWKIRGIMDQMAGGVGMRRGRRSVNELAAGDALDFWRVLAAEKRTGWLLLYAEMKLPGEAWLEFRLANNELIQTATFRPRGVWGRLYWYAVWPFHGFIFRGLSRRLSQ
jgi:uncharacterized protein YbjT (DUF2867 family)